MQSLRDFIRTNASKALDFTDTVVNYTWNDRLDSYLNEVSQFNEVKRAVSSPHILVIQSLHESTLFV